MYNDVSRKASLTFHNSALWLEISIMSYTYIYFESLYHWAMVINLYNTKVAYLWSSKYKARIYIVYYISTFQVTRCLDLRLVYKPCYFIPYLVLKMLSRCWTKPHRSFTLRIRAVRNFMAHWILPWTLFALAVQIQTLNVDYSVSQTRRLYPEEFQN